MRRKIIAGNWKMNLGYEEAMELVRAIDLQIPQSLECEVVLFPSYLYLAPIINDFGDSFIEVGAQNCSQYLRGAYTGEVSVLQLRDIGAKYVLIGHSERREYFKENNATLKKKTALAIEHDLTPVFCCGEPLEIRNAGKQQQYVSQQLQESLFDFSTTEFAKIVIAYEPIWAIGTGLNASAAQVHEMHSFIRQTIASEYSTPLAQQVRILYGGSVKPENAKELFSCADVDGGLIGGASLKANDFLSIIESAK
ncbi:MAG: triosephosphate isomerase [Bacteroidota bacterium]|nr:triosephosphate isomerase [Bacteroidota bacterium]